MYTPNQTYKVYEYFDTKDEDKRMILALDAMDAAYMAAELCGGTNNVSNVRLCDEW